VRAKPKSQAIDRAIAVHEAGHAVGRFLTAARLGHKPNTAIAYIDVHEDPSFAGSMSFSGSMGLQSQTATFGPMFSQALSDFIMANAIPDGSAGEISLNEVAHILTKARTAGLDVDDWFQAKAFINVLGPMAEAKLLEKPFEIVWADYSSEDDIRRTAKEGALAGLTPEQIDHAAHGIIETAKREIARPKVWRAILALADNLTPGRMDGRIAARIIARAMTQSRSRTR
jgi:hypothetical protein